MATYVTNDVTRSREVMSTITGATTLTAATSGTVYTIPAATAGAAITLPAVQSGLKFKFIMAGAFATTDWTIVTASAAKVMSGSALVDDTQVPAVLETTASFVASAESIGDWIELVCDGTSWFVSGDGQATGSITFTGA